MAAITGSVNYTLSVRGGTHQVSDILRSPYLEPRIRFIVVEKLVRDLRTVETEDGEHAGGKVE